MDSTGQLRTFETGAVRDAASKKPMLQLISPHAMNRLGEWLRFACVDRKPKPYPVRNWEKGMPFSEVIGSLQRHVEKFKLGDESEDHIAAILFGGMALAHYQEEIAVGHLDPALDDMPDYGCSPATQARIQANLDETFKDEDTVYTAEPIKNHAIFCICADHRAYASPETATGFFASVFAAEDLPAGVPIRQIEPEALTQPHFIRDYSKPAVGDRCGNSVFVHVEGNGDRVIPAGTPMVQVPGKQGTVTRPVPTHPFTVYLCGPITGQECDYLWREAATKYLALYGIKTLDPLRGKKKDDVGNLGLSYKGQLAAPEIAERDRMDIEEADVIFAHFPYEPPRQSIGSMMEMGAAAIGFKKTVILCTDVTVFNEHLFCRNFCTLEPNFEIALNRIVAMSHVHKESGRG